MTLEELDQLAAAPKSKSRIVIGIPSAGRPEVLERTVRELHQQIHLPDAVYVCVPKAEDTGGLEDLDMPFPIHVLISAPGLSRQRNAILAALDMDDILLFLDDDFMMAADYVAQLERTLKAHPDVIEVTGTVIEDGILGPGLNHDQGAQILSRADKADYTQADLRPVANGYGCNTAFRARPILENNIVYDERLPLYSWLEDVDFSSSISHLGRIVKSEAMRGVHLGTKRGRTPGRNLGYSQIANPIYLARKGTLPMMRALRLMSRNFASNLARSLRPLPWADHRGRLIGNLRAFWHVVQGECDPVRLPK